MEDCYRHLISGSSWQRHSAVRPIFKPSPGASHAALCGSLWKLQNRPPPRSAPLNIGQTRFSCPDRTSEHIHPLGPKFTS